MTNSIASPRAILLVSLAITTVILVALAVADDQSEAAAVNTPAVDSVYTEIQSGFATLEPIWIKACYDCHSDRTRYPWYYKLPLVRGLIDSDIQQAREELDMSGGFPFKSTRRPVDDLRKLREEIAEGAMPPWNYKLMHWSAGLSDEEKQSVYQWIDSSLQALAAHGIEPSRRNRGGNAEPH